MKRFFKLTLVIVGAVSVTALGIDAADTLSGSRSTLLGQLSGVSGQDCPTGMLAIPAATTFTCVDMYEASATEDCPYQNPKNSVESQENLLDINCTAVSEEAQLPWRFISRDEAQTVCLRGGKRLPTNEEWQLISLGTQSTRCNIESLVVSGTGSYSECVSAVGVHDTVGNVWEWMSEDVVNGTFNGRELPESGYVEAADMAGIAVTTSDEPSEQYEYDYFWSRPDSVSVIMRGGFYGSGEDAGVYSTHADVPPQMRGEAIGFRCVQ